MSRRSHIVRTDSDAGTGPPRSLGGANIYCYIGDGHSMGSSETPALIGPIDITVIGAYQRVFVSATVTGLGAELDAGDISVEIATESGEVVASTRIRGDQISGALTGVTDLSEGNHQIFLRVYTDSGNGYVGRGTLQAITGQHVAEPGCPYDAVGGG